MANSKKVHILIYIEIDLYIISLFLILLLTKYAPALEQVLLHGFKPEVKHDMFVAFLVLIGIGRLISFIQLIVLFKGYEQRSEKKLKFWFGFECIGVAFVLLAIISTLAKDPKAFVLIIPLIMTVIYKIWTLVVVKRIINKIQAGPQHPPFRAVHA